MNIFKSKNRIEITEINYDGIARVLDRFVQLYKVCDNKDLLDKHLDRFLSPYIINK